MLVIKDNEAHCQPCFSPVWDTALVTHALIEAGSDAVVAPVGKALEWLKPRQILDVAGDWAVKRPSTRPGGWAVSICQSALSRS